MEKIKKHILNLQNSHRTVKQIWLVGLSGAAMLIVISLWALYITARMPTLSSPKTEANIQSKNEEVIEKIDERPRVSRIFAAGLKVIAAKMLDTLGANNHLIIGRPNFQIDDLNPINPTPLP